MKNIKSEEMLHIVQHEMRTQHQIKVFDPYGFNNTYTIEMLCPHTEKLGIEKISDLAKYPDLIAGFDKKFILLDVDGAVPTFATYSFEPTNPVSHLEFDEKYSALSEGRLPLLVLI